MGTHLEINEMLCFLSSQTGNLDRNSLISVLTEFYSLDEAKTAKFLLIAECKSLGISHVIDNIFKKHFSKNNILRSTVEDVLDIWDVINRHHEAGKIKWNLAAADVNRLPSFKTETSDIKFFVMTVLQLRKKVISLENIVTKIDKCVEKISAVTSLRHDKSIAIESLLPALPQMRPQTPTGASEDETLFSAYRKSAVENSFVAQKSLVTSAFSLVPMKKEVEELDTDIDMEAAMSEIVSTELAVAASLNEPALVVISAAEQAAAERAAVKRPAPLAQIEESSHKSADDSELKIENLNGDNPLIAKKLLKCQQCPYATSC